MSQTSKAMSRDPNLCPSCSSLADGMDEPAAPAQQNSLPRDSAHALNEAPSATSNAKATVKE